MSDQYIERVHHQQRIAIVTKAIRELFHQSCPPLDFPQQQRPTAVATQLPTVESDLPGGAKRLKQRATGFKATVVAGQVVLRDGEHTGALPGALLRGPLAAR